MCRSYVVRVVSVLKINLSQWLKWSTINIGSEFVTSAAVPGVESIVHIQGVTGGMGQTSGGRSLC